MILIYQLLPVEVMIIEVHRENLCENAAYKEICLNINVFCCFENSNLLFIRVLLLDDYTSGAMLMLFLFVEGVDYSVLDAKDPESLTEEEKIALLGRPVWAPTPRFRSGSRSQRSSR
jgi:hypothetical protein